MRPGAQHTSSEITALQRWSAAFALVAFALLSWMSVDAHAHARLHPDADHAEHTCAVVDFAHAGATEFGIAAIVLAAVCWSEVGLIVLASALRVEKTFRLPWSQGPPVLVQG